MYKAVYLSPMIPSYNISETARFFTALFSFTPLLNTPGYVVLLKDHLSIHILNAGADIGEMEFYLEVDALDELWESIKDKLTDIKTRPPFDREYGMREFHLIIPHTKTLLFVGQSIKSQD